MKVGILSDIHDNVWKLAGALAGLQEAEVLICCGDLCSPFIIGLLAEGFRDRPIHIVFGNNDADLFRITNNAKKYAHVHLHGEFFQAELGGKHFAVNHFDYLARPIAASGQYDVVCYGHNHIYKIEPVGRTLTINPGAIMGYDPVGKKDIPSTFVLYETETGSASGYEVGAAQVILYTHQDNSE
ncbi:MAG: phosphodiesterase [Chloroflexota bacterium]|nr:MAG: phosphodiesterase [Chloroflexota bacterium]